MRWDGETTSHKADLQRLIEELHCIDYHIDDRSLSQLVDFGPQAIPFLEQMITTATERSSQINPSAQKRGPDWFAVIHALSLLAELRAAESLETVLRFLALPQPVIDYWLHELFDEHIWDILFHMGSDRPKQLGSFILQDKNNRFSRLAACTALIQVALHYPEKQAAVVESLTAALKQPSRDSEYTGLLVSEILDLRHEDLRPALIQALERDAAWSGIVSIADVEVMYRSHASRKLQPHGIFERYDLFRRYSQFTLPAVNGLATPDRTRKTQKFR